MIDTTVNPLILTLNLEHTVQVYFDKLRKLHFPAPINYLNAHLTLFHQLPANEKSILSDLHNISSNQSKLLLKAGSIGSIGNGTAYYITNNMLMTLHLALQKKWQQWLIPQDKQKLWPHITIQNKVSAHTAKQLQQQLNTGFEPFEFYANGLSLWEYQGGPWKFVRNFDFKE